MAIHEQTLNDAIAQILDGLRPGWSAEAEQSGAMAKSAKRPDIVVRGGGFSVVVENEFAPARTVDDDARARLGRRLSDGKNAEIVAFLSSPAALRNTERRDLEAKIRAAEFGYGLYFMEDGESRRFPASGFLPGSIRDFGQFVFRAAIPAQAVKNAVNILEDDVQQNARFIMERTREFPHLLADIAKVLKQEAGEQTCRMAFAILANAFVFHENIAAKYDEIKPLEQLQKEDAWGRLYLWDVAAEWRKILAINYWPIFDSASDILAQLPSHFSGELAGRLQKTAKRLIDEGVYRSHDLSGQVFQRIIADRKFLATFYTRPPSAALLAHLAIPEDAPFADGDWQADAHRYTMTDFACGTGTLLSAAYKRAAELHELRGGDAAQIHGAMMERALVGCDVMPSAVHLTASMLCGLHPAETFADTRLYTLPYGEPKKGEYRLGSLELLKEQEVLPTMATAPERVEARGKKSGEMLREIPWGTMRLVIMNPPFTNPTNHEGRHADVPNPAFAAFGADPKLQKALGEHSKRLRAGTCGSGNAGIASDFVALADKFVAADGVVALILPLAALAGDSWSAARALWAKNYRDICIISISAPDIRECSFSADTGMAEILFIARKNGKNKPGATRCVFIMLNKRPDSEMESGEIARLIRRAVRGEIRKLEDGLYGGTDLIVGDAAVGAMIDAPLPQDKPAPWSVGRIQDLTLAQTAHFLTTGKLWLPRMTAAKDIPIAKFGDIASRGFIDRDINGKQPDGSPRGPFDLKTPCSGQATYPCLWNHDAQKETKMQVAPDGELVMRRGMKDRAAAVWKTASRAHFNRDFQYNSQPLAVAMTATPTIGGTAWPNLIFKNRRHEIAYALWGNSTLGLLCHWWWSSKQQEGRGRITVTRIPGMPALDVRKLSARQLTAAEKIFAEMKETPLLPLAEAGRDAARKQLDDAFALRVLELDESKIEPLDLLRAKLAAEPSVRGGKYN